MPGYVDSIGTPRLSLAPLAAKLPRSSMGLMAPSRVTCRLVHPRLGARVRWITAGLVDRGRVDWRYACCVLARPTCPQNDDNSPRGTTKRKGAARGQKGSIAYGPPSIQPLDQARYSVQMERIETTNADRIAWCCQQLVLRRMNLQLRLAYRRRLWIGRWPARLRLPSPKRALTRGGRKSFNRAYE